MRDPYQLLEVDRGASTEVIAAAYRVLAKRLHPDLAGPTTTGEMAALNAAYEVLADPVRRAEYDRSRQAPRPAQRTVYMRFGRYKGQPIEVVPTEYLLWVVENVNREGDIFDATEELVRRGMA